MSTTQQHTSPARYRFLSSILATAVEGGINYWARITGVTTGLPEDVRADKYQQVLDAEAYTSVTLLADGEQHVVTLSSLERGIERLNSLPDSVPQVRGHQIISSGSRDTIRNGAQANESWMIDSVLADWLVQFSIFDTIRYS